VSGHRITGPGGTIEIAGGALTQLVVQAAESVPGARVRRPRRGLDVEVAAGRARVELELAVVFGDVIPDVARVVQERVTDALREMCGLVVDAVDVSVEELDG
jgi:uncharacterized alkaline shock family protein YloU